MISTTKTRSRRMEFNHAASIALTIAISCFSPLPILAAGPPATQASAWALYTQNKFRESADAFEEVMRTSPPNARLYYYAALANRAGNRVMRAKQLCQYIITNFGTSPEAAYAQKLCPDAAPPKSAAVPDSLKGKSMQELMKTEEGRKALEEALSKKEAAKSAEASKVSPMVARSKGGRPGERVFSADEIAKDGAAGIDQMYYPNCWFESSLSAMAMLPRGRKMLADMIRYGDKEGTYVVRFPADGKAYVVTEKILEGSGIHDKALWATLIECAQTLKFPDDNGGQLADGLACLAGTSATTLNPDTAANGELVSLITGGVKSQCPVICGSRYSLSGLPPLVFPSHAYTIVGFEPSSGMVEIRNPHGINSQRFALNNDPHHEKFQQLDDGLFKMHISLFKLYFAQVACANI